MAFTVANIAQSTFGNKRVVVLSCVADAATQAIDTGLSGIDFIQYTPKSMTSAAAKFRINSDASGDASAGYVGVSGVANGDEFWLTVYGH